MLNKNIGKRLIRESQIQYKYKSYNLLLEALVGIYAKISEDYFGKFSFKDGKKLISNELKVKINPGNMIEEVKTIIRQEIENHTLSEYDFEDINKIRIRSILNTTHYELPIDIKMYLINEGRYDGKTVKRLIESSTNVSDSFRRSINNAIFSESTYKNLLDTKLINQENGKIHFPIEMEIPKEISEKNKKIFLVQISNGIMKNLQE